MNDLDFDYDLSGEHQITLVNSQPGTFKYHYQPKNKKPKPKKEDKK